MSRFTRLYGWWSAPLLALIMAGLSPSPAKGNFYALLVGVSDYPGTVDDLRYCHLDALDMATSLLAYDNWDARNGVLLLNQQATYDKIRQSIESLGSRMTADDVFLFSFSGHGTSTLDRPPFDERDLKDEYICAYDQDIRDDEFSDWIAALPTENVVIVIDACFSGGMLKAPDGGKAKVFRGAAGPLLRGDGFDKDLDGLPGVVALTACAADEESLELPVIRNGVFTFLVTQAMRAFPDPNGDGVLSAEEIHGALNQTRLFDLLRQHPQIYDGYPVGDPGSGEMPVCVR